MDPVHDNFFKRWEFYTYNLIMKNKKERYDTYEQKVYRNACVSYH